MTQKRQMPASWDALLANVERAITGSGRWSGEARDLRDAAGRKRLGRVGGQIIVDALEQAGYEVEVEFGEPPQFESELVTIRRAGATDLVKTIEALLPSIREADRVVPASALWRDAVVAEYAMRAWRGKNER